MNKRSGAMNEFNLQLPSGHFGVEIISQLVENRCQKVARIKQAVTEGCYQVNSRNLANILILKFIIGSVPSNSQGSLLLPPKVLLGALAQERLEKGADQPAAS